MKKYWLILGGILIIGGVGVYYWYWGRGYGKIELQEEKLTVATTMKVTSAAFNHTERIPEQYTCKGQNINPPLVISAVPEGVQSFVLIVEDPDAPIGTWDHWLLFNIEPTVREIIENSVPPGGIQVKNSFGKVEYGGPCPPPGSAHRYFFKIYALNAKLNPTLVQDKKTLLALSEGRVLASAELIGTFSR